MMFWYYMAKILYWVFFLLTGVALCIVLKRYLKKAEKALAPRDRKQPDQPYQPPGVPPTVSSDKSMWKDGIYQAFWDEEEKSD